MSFWATAIVAASSAVAAPMTATTCSVVGAIERQAAILASKAPDDERLKALKYLVHFVADIHQPLQPVGKKRREQFAFERIIGRAFEHNVVRAFAHAVHRASKHAGIRSSR